MLDHTLEHRYDGFIMRKHELVHAPATDGLVISPGFERIVNAVEAPPRAQPVDIRVAFICLLAVGVGIGSALSAQILVRLIALITNISFFGRVSTGPGSPAENHLGLLVLIIPVIGALLVGLMARYGSKAIRGHGIPEAMEQVLQNQSRIPARMMFLKPLSAAISIGTGGPFGAEGPIIATGGAMGSQVGQIVNMSSAERRTMLAAGAAAGMAAIFGTPVAAVLLAIELLLFEFRPRSLIPVALAATVATGIRAAFEGMGPTWPVAEIVQPSGGALVSYVVIGGVMGLIAVGVTKVVYAVEDAFERLPVHWMWWPAIGAVAVGAIGFFVPRTLGVGYDNITDIVSKNLPLKFVVILCAMKFLSWSIALGSGTSGGTLAPLFTIGAGAGAVLGAAIGRLLPGAGVDPGVAALVGMAAMFSGASRAMLASVVFAFEVTRQPLGLLPLLGGCTASYLIASLITQHSIMTEKIARRGVRVPAEYTADPLDQVLVRNVAEKGLITLRDCTSLLAAQEWLRTALPEARHQGFPVVGRSGTLLGVVTRRDILTDGRHEQTIEQMLRRPPVIVYDDCTLRDATNHMLNHDVGRLPVISRQDTGRLVGIITRSDILSAYRKTTDESRIVAKGEGI